MAVTARASSQLKSRVRLTTGLFVFALSIVCSNWPALPATAESITHSYRLTKTMASGSGDYSQATQVKTDSDGNVYTLGLFKGTVTFDGPGGTHTATSASVNPTLYLTKHSSDGDYQWTKTLGLSTLGQVIPMGLAIDSSDNVYFTAWFSSTIDLSDFTGGQSDTMHAGATDSFVMKLNADGTHAWHKHIISGDDSQATAMGLAVDYAGNVDVVGYYNGEVQFDENDNTTITTCGSCTDMYTVQFDADGNYNWMASTQAGSHDDFVQPYAVAVKSNNDIVVTGSYKGTGGGDMGIDTDGFYHDFISYIGSDGTYLNTTLFDDTDGQATNYGVAIDWSDNVYVTGAFTGTVVFDGPGGIDDRTAQGSDNNAYLTKINNDSSYGWTKTFDNTDGSSVGYGVALDSYGNIYTLGTFTGDVEFGSGDTQSSNGSAVYFTSYTYSGDYRYTQIISPGSGNIANSPGSLSIQRRTLYMVGGYNGTLTFDGPGGIDTRTAAGPDYDGFVSSWYLGPRPATNTNERVVKITSPANGHSFSGSSMHITGTSFPGAVITVKIDGTTAGTATANDDGEWEFTAAGQSTGDHTIIAEYRPNAPIAYMGNSNRRKVHIVDIVHHTALATIDLSSGNGYPNSLAISPTGKIVLATSGSQCYVGLIDQNTSAVTKLAERTDMTYCAYGGIAFSADNTIARITTLLYDGVTTEGRILSINLATGATVGDKNIGFECPEPYGIGLNSDQNEYWVSCIGRVNVYNSSNLNLKHTIDLTGDNAQMYANFVFANGKVYISDGANDQIRIFDDDGSYNELTPFSHGTNSVYSRLAYAPSSGTLYALVPYSGDNGSQLTLIDTSDDSWIKDVHTEQPPESIAIDAATGDFVVGDDHSSGEVYFGDDTSQTITNAIAFPGGSFYTLNSDFLLPASTTFSDSVHVSVTAASAGQTGGNSTSKGTRSTSSDSNQTDSDTPVISQSSGGTTNHPNTQGNQAADRNTSKTGIVRHMAYALGGIGLIIILLLRRSRSKNRHPN